MNILFFALALIGIASAKQCEHLWLKYNGNEHPKDYGILAGYMRPDLPLYVGRGMYDGIPIIGRIQIQYPAGLYHVSAWKKHYIVDSAEYLVRNPHYTYKWVKNGRNIQNVIPAGNANDYPGRIICSVGRLKIGNFYFYGKVITNEKMHYEDEDGNEVPADNFEVLTCEPYDSQVCFNKNDWIEYVEGITKLQIRLKSETFWGS